jgi:hypothetical protein
MLSFIFISTIYIIKSFRAIFCSANPDDPPQLLRISEGLLHVYGPGVCSVS